MSILLYRLGRWCFRAHRRVLVIWVLALVILGALAGVAGGKYNDNFTIPGAPAAKALAQLDRTFPQAAAQSATALIVLPQGSTMSDPAVKSVVTAALARFEKVPGVSTAMSPYSTLVSGLITPDGRAATIQIQFKTASLSDVTNAERSDLIAVGRSVQKQLPAGSQVDLGGAVFSIEAPGLSVTEAIGLVVALVVLVMTLGSFVAAGLPLVTAVFGVGLTMALMTVSARFTEVNSTAPILAVMLGLAVGIDYALFILSRHRDQLRLGMSVEESAAESVATAGSAVVFAGLTVVIALVGLTLAGIPFLSVMGIFAAIGVAIGVVVALTMLPAAMGFLGERMRPRPRTRPRNRRPREPFAPRFFSGWVRASVKWPIVTIVVIVVALGALSVPAKDLFLALPTSGDHKAGQPDRVTYDKIGQYFGPGYNGPLIVTVDILTSTDPLGVMNGLKADIEKLPGVAAVPLATPNQNADTGFIQVIPTTGPTDPGTKALVTTLRDHHDAWLKQFGVDTAVTGQTAIQLDVSSRLSSALLPFGIFVVGLSLVLLMMVFRSIWVPVKATVGYLLSIGAAFGTTNLVFNRGIGHQLVNLEKAGSVISFLPIIVMGILFGLAMDYEVFLVSRIREDFVHAVRRGVPRQQAARESVISGFVASGKVVLAAAVIMFSVFAFFVPEGDGSIKSIAFALAIGVAVDAFLVRMTLVPAVLTLLGERAWRLPGWLDRALPSFDVEGESLAVQLSLSDWPTTDHTESAHVQELANAALFAPMSLHLDPGDVGVVAGDASVRRAALLALTGRLTTDTGRARICGELLPEQAGAVRRRTAFIAAADHSHLGHEIDAALARGPRLIIVDDADTVADEAGQRALGDLVHAARSGRGLAVVLGVSEPDLFDQIHPEQVVVIRPPFPASVPESEEEGVLS
ncbi:MAG: MMPL family transporter [Propionibacterium sp.]|nr:MMPL family transporter [Propionibacterium sp.]